MLRDGQAPCDIRFGFAVPELESGSRLPLGAHFRNAPALESSAEGGQAHVDTQSIDAPLGEVFGGGQLLVGAHNGSAPADSLLLLCADLVDNLEEVRRATDNRLRSLRGVKRAEGTPEERRLGKVAAGLRALEHAAELELKRGLRAHPLGPWQKRTVGIGEKQFARLLAAIGDPAERPNPGKLLQYCGHGDPRRSRQSKENIRYYVDEDGRRRAVLAFGPEAKKRVYLCAKSCMRQRRSPYRKVYERERAKWAARDTSDAHKHAHALRVVGKEILKDLWREARALA